MLYENTTLRIEGRIIVHSITVSSSICVLTPSPPRELFPWKGFDEYMNLVLDDAEEVSLKNGTRTPLGRILLKGDNITLMMNTSK